MIEKQLKSPLRSPLMRAILAGSGAAAPAIADPRFVLVGDSLHMFSNRVLPISGATVTRDAAGIVNVNKTTHQLYGTHPVALVNLTDPAFEGYGMSTYVDANNFTIATGVTGAAGSTTGMALGHVTASNAFSQKGPWMWFQSLMKGGGRLLNNFGQGGDRLDEMTLAVSKACATSAEFVIMNGGINDLNASASAATIISRAQTHVTTILAAGKKVILLAITPLGSTWPATEAKKLTTKDANSGFAAIAATNPTSVFFVDAYTPLADPAYQGAGLDGRCYSWAVYDGVHWSQRAAHIIGAAMFAAVSSKITTSSVLPANSSDMPVVAGFTAIKQYGPWTNAGGGYNNTGSTGTVQPRLQVFPGPNTTVNTLVDRGADGYWQRHTITPGGSGSFTDYIQTNAGETLASLGLTTTDEVMLAVEVQVTGGSAAGFREIIAHLNLDTEIQGKCYSGGAEAGSQVFTDTFTEVLIAGPLKLTAATTKVHSRISLSFVGVSANTCTVDIGRIVLFKKTA